MSDAIERATKVIWAAIERQADVVANGMHLDVQGVLTPHWIAEALATNGLLSPAPLREEWGIEGPDGEQVKCASPQSASINAATEGWRMIRRYRTDWGHFDPSRRAEGDGRADASEPTVRASQLRAFARLCVDGGDMTPAAARMLDRIIEGDGRAVL